MIITTNEPTEYGASSVQKKTSLKPANDKNIFDKVEATLEKEFNRLEIIDIKKWAKGHKAYYIE